jgi:hypothetical protein
MWYNVIKVWVGLFADKAKKTKVCKDWQGAKEQIVEYIEKQVLRG